MTTEIGDWQDLSVAISGWLPDAREPFDMGNRQIVFKAMSNIKGITADAEIAVTFIHPGSGSADWVDRAGITGLCGLRRLRPGTPMVVMHGHSIAPPPGARRTSLVGEPIDQPRGAGAPTGLARSRQDEVYGTRRELAGRHIPATDRNRPAQRQSRMRLRWGHGRTFC